MKKVLLITVGLLLSIGMQAQDTAPNSTQGWIGGTGGFNAGGIKDENDDTKSVSTFKYNVGPSFGYMLDNDMAVGINMLFYADNSILNDSMKSETAQTGFTFQPFFRYYFAVNTNFKFYGDFSVGFGQGTTTYSDITGITKESKNGKFNAGITAGAQYWFNSNWSMASSIGLLGYSQYTSNVGEKDSAGNSLEKVTSDFGLNATFSTLNFSFFHHF
tara:strand:+ start:16662 stop:17309 length:648 start_codon:yes stop_codon:yes gene_type:complete